MATAPLNQQLTWPERKAQLQQVTDWEAKGLVGIRYQGKAQSANVYMTVDNTHYQLQLYGPLGADRVIIEGSQHAVSMRTSDGKILKASSPEKLLQQQLGWSLPVSNMLYWLRGLPAPNIKSNISYDQYNHIKSMHQQGWLIYYMRFAGVQGNDLPTKILMQNEKLRATIVISSWDFNN